jgi:hypothetical protein
MIVIASTAIVPSRGGPVLFWGAKTIIRSVKFTLEIN